MTQNSSTPRARRLRQDANAPEQVAWQALRGLGWDFLRVPASDVFDADHLMGLVQERLGL